MLSGLPALLPTAARPAATTPAIVASAKSAVFLRTRFIHLQRTTVHFLTVQTLNGLHRFVPVRHFDESEPARLARIAVPDDTSALHSAKVGKSDLEFFFRGLVRKISYENVRHAVF
jgi:hypothetical protein